MKCFLISVIISLWSDPAKSDWYSVSIISISDSVSDWLSLLFLRSSRIGHHGHPKGLHHKPYTLYSQTEGIPCSHDEHLPEEVTQCIKLLNNQVIYICIRRDYSLGLNQQSSYILEKSFQFVEQITKCLCFGFISNGRFPLLYWLKMHPFGIHCSNVSWFPYLKALSE